MGQKKEKSSRSVWIKSGIQAVGITGVIAVLFYRSVWGMVLFPWIWIVRCKQVSHELEQKRLHALELEFMHGMQTLNQGLQAGLSMENAWYEVQKETGYMYGEESEFYQKIKDMNQSVQMNIPMEQLFLEFAYDSTLEDAISFAEIFVYGKRCGGNWKKIIDTLVYRMKERHEVRKEIALLVAQKEMEQKIMNLMPCGMLAFLQIFAGDYMAVLYHNKLGILCMSICLIAYVAAMILSEKILQIRV